MARLAPGNGIEGLKELIGVDVFINGALVAGCSTAFSSQSRGWYEMEGSCGGS